MFFFGLPFVLAGLGVGFVYWGMLADWYRAQTWVQVPCVLERSELRDHMERRSGSSSSRDTLMNEAEALYRYTYAGREHTGNRVSLSLGADNFGDFQERVAQQMQEARNHAGGAFHCYVNPAQPHESVLFRQARWTLLLFMSVFPLMFPLVGAFISLAGLRGMGTRKKIHALQSQFPDQPWRWNPDKQGEWLLPENRPRPVRATVTLVWMSLVWGPMLFALGVESDMSLANPVSLMGLLPVLPLGLMAVHTLRSWARHARPVPQVHVQPLPVRTGGPLHVQVALPQGSETPLRALAEDQLHARLSCARRWMDHSGESSTVREEQVWTDEQTVPLSSAVREAQGSRVEVKFDLPLKAPAPEMPHLGRADDGGPDWVWALELRAPGWPQNWRYDLPVYAGGATTPGTPESEADAALGQLKNNSEAAHRMLELDADEVEMHLRKSGMTLQRDGQGRPEFFDMPSARFASGRTVLTIITGILFFVVALLLFFQANGIVQLVFGLFLAITGFITFTLYTERQLRVEPEALEIIWRVGPWRKAQRLTRQEITRFDSNQNMYVGNTSYYQVVAHTHMGKKLALMDGLQGKAVAEGIIKLLQRWHRPLG